MSKLKFSKIKYDPIFSQDFNEFNINNEITFSKEGFAILYAPNGVGKSSLTKVVNKQEGTAYEVYHDGNKYTTEDDKNLFHTIGDQNSRNIIQGTSRDFIVSDNIREEYDLKDKIDSELAGIKNSLINSLKGLGISKKSSEIIGFADEPLKSLIAALSNNRDKAKNYNVDEILDILKNLTRNTIEEYDTRKLEAFKSGYDDKKSSLRIFLSIPLEDIDINTKIHEVEENSDAIGILTKHQHATDCIVCDSKGIDTKSLAQIKDENRKTILKALDPSTRRMIDSLLDPASSHYDAFDVKSTVYEYFGTGNIALIKDLRDDINSYGKITIELIKKDLTEILAATDLSENCAKYNRLRKNPVEIDDEDMLFLEEIVEGSMDKKVTVSRANQGNGAINIHLDDKEFIGKERTDIPLSSGEQNFISLMFEILKAKNSHEKIIVFDDPISSFDSIYKYKIVYAIINAFSGESGKSVILLTHNHDLLRLLDIQYKSCFSLYILNNQEGGNNGFIFISPSEKSELIYIDKLLNFLRSSDILGLIKDKELFLQSITPFMRGYARITGDMDAYESLTSVMHGYNKNEVDLSNYYSKLFGVTIIDSGYSVGANDIINSQVDISRTEILEKSTRSLLNKVLVHSLIYLRLRLYVEKELVSRFSIDTNRHYTLDSIIKKAYGSGNRLVRRKRMQLMSKKSLVNEFNHFEGSMSIFQPAIDISDESLAKEQDKILNFFN